MDKDPCKTRLWQKMFIRESKTYTLIWIDEYGRERIIGGFDEKWTAEQVKKLLEAKAGKKRKK
jgi:hypothetical protein